jgi:hypothetical protein
MPLNDENKGIFTATALARHRMNSVSDMVENRLKVGSP